MSRTSLVTGGAGFLGSHVAQHLVSAGDRVIVLDDLSGGFERNVPDGAELVVGSILDDQLVDRLVIGRSVDRIYHLAAYAAEGLSHFIRRFNYANNLIGSVNLVNAAVRSGTVSCFVFTSSAAVYGAGQLPFDEADTPVPEDPYGIAKLAVEQDLRAAHQQFDLDVVVLRPHNVYGERQHLGDRYRNVVGIFMNAAMRGEPFRVFGDGEQRRAFTHVSDITPLIAGSPDVDAAIGRAINIGSDTSTSVNELAVAVARAMGVEPRIEHLPARNEVMDALPDHSLARQVFGRVAETSLEVGLSDMAAWARAVGPMEPSSFGPIEVERGLPPSWRT